MIISTTNDIANYRVVRHLGLVRGITVRSRSVLGNFGRSAIGLRRQALDLRQPCGNGQEAFDHMCEHAAQGDANAIVGWPTARRSGWSPPEQAALVRPECAG
jgi:uncharacterized protein YbjQ (UPF0145 family)